ncbi:hypothetical protein [Erythrobacter ani]|uniref:Uncharacterized protein n=1 Tax=Erythrobacter ani TaxID=2827235 RepID=A0ABS6SLS7_9SPHN|nr:hypothetical protein [Erythrobacter ani]MBV7265462.1 hypothetical protein [Erythrobacter ani]
MEIRLDEAHTAQMTLLNNAVSGEAVFLAICFERYEANAKVRTTITSGGGHFTGIGLNKLTRAIPVSIDGRLVGAPDYEATAIHIEAV